MSHEVFTMIQGMDLKSVETQLALQCAPLITGLKISNLLNVAKESEKLVCAFLKKSKISYYLLMRTKQKIFFLLFNRIELEKYMAQEEMHEWLRKEGYTELGFGKILRTFRNRYQKHMEEGKEFPHEMGIILGYPMEDVKGFVENQGKNFLYSGYWKVYENKQEKILLFQKFEQAKETLIQMLGNGIDMLQIIEYYREVQFAAG